MAHHGRRFEAELVEEFVVIEDKIPQVIQGFDRVRIACGCARMFRRINREVAREQVEAFVPDKPVAIVEIDQRRTLAGNLDVRVDRAIPEDNSAFRRGRHRYLLARAESPLAPRAAPAFLPPSIRRFGHQLLTQPSSSHTLRKCGRTSLLKRSIFLSVNSCGIEPICSSTIRLPTRSFFTAAINWSRSVAGLPAMTN